MHRFRDVTTTCLVYVSSCDLEQSRNSVQLYMTFYGKRVLANMFHIVGHVVYLDRFAMAEIVTRNIT